MSAVPRYVFFRAASGHLGCDVVLRLPDAARHVQQDAERLLRQKEIQLVPAEHRRLLMQLVMQGSKQGGRTLLRGGSGFTLARALVASGRAHWLQADSHALRWQKACPTELTWSLFADGGHGTALRPAEPVDFILPLTPPLYVTRNGLCGPLTGDTAEGALAAWAEPRAPMLLADAIAFCNSLSRRFPDARFPVPGQAAEPDDHPVCPHPRLLLTSRPGHAGDTQAGPQATAVPVVRLSFTYGTIHISPGAPELSIVLLQDGRLLRCRRDVDRERAATDRLRALGFAPFEERYAVAVAVPLRDWALRADAAGDWATLQESGFEALRAEGWSVEQDPGCTLRAVSDDQWFSEMQAADEGWFSFSLGIRVGRKRVNLMPVVQQFLAENRTRTLEEMAAMLEGRRIPVPLKRGEFALISGSRLLLVIRHVLELFDREAAADKQGRLRLDLWRAAELSALEQLAEAPWTRPVALRSLAERLNRVTALTPHPGPASLQTTLRSYQQLGLAWLQFLREAAFDGILADDMGLGKTVQTLAHLLIEKEAGRLQHPCLIVTPTSVIQNWIDETARFAPSLRLLVLQGAERHASFEEMGKADLVLTSYALLRRDAEVLHAQAFALVILDEGHYIKNHRAQTTLVARGIRAERRLCLTGTPLENNLGELWSLFQFLMPGFLGSMDAFQTRFRHPIEREGSVLARQFLNRRLAPFLLRRRKADVERDLPAKTVMIQRIPLGERQLALYEAVRLAMESRIQDEVAQRGLERSRITVLAALLKLRQVCCDPRLVRARDARTLTTEDSAKLQFVMDMLSELLEEGRRVLLFSQFVGMLSLIEAELKARGQDYALLTGATRDRVTPVRRFQAGEVPLFLISLKAGGTGLNLTAADTVIHYDPWWNPAVEAQATDRAHRIGQDKPVFVYRLLAQGSVEERIHALQARKQALTDGILRAQRSDSIRFAQEDLDALLAPISPV